MADGTPTPEIGRAKRSTSTLGKTLKRGVAAGVFGVGMAFGAAGPVSGAETQTPTPTKPPASGTPTPDAKSTEIAALQATITDAQKRRSDATAIAVAEATKEESLRRVQGTATALATSPTSTPESTRTSTRTETPPSTPTRTVTTTPTSTGTPDAAATSTKVAEVEKAVVQELADRKAAKATRDEAARIESEKLTPSATSTATRTPTRTPTPTPTPNIVEGATETIGNLPPVAKVGGLAVAGGVLGIAAVAGFRGVRALINRFRGGRGTTGGGAAGGTGGSVILPTRRPSPIRRP